jgi:hypothetical protein
MKLSNLNNKNKDYIKEMAVDIFQSTIELHVIIFDPI